MDENKKVVLESLPYEIKKCCGLCAHGVFPQSEWGTCAVTKYTHLKHTGEQRQLSINKFGSCPKWEPKQPDVAKLGFFVHFMKT